MLTGRKPTCSFSGTPWMAFIILCNDFEPFTEHDQFLDKILDSCRNVLMPITIKIPNTIFFLADEFEVEDDEEEDATIPSYAMELFRRRNGSTEMWRQIENEIYGLPKIQVETSVVPVDNQASGVNADPEIVVQNEDDEEDDEKRGSVEKSLDSNPDENFRSKNDETRRNQFRNRPHRLWRQSTEEFYMSTSSSGNKNHNM